MCVSIHAPREGSDFKSIQDIIKSTVSIHAPREGSDIGPLVHCHDGSEFQSTLPVKGATS